MSENLNVRISLNLSEESYNYLTAISKIKKRKVIIEEALNLHKNNSINEHKLAFLKSQVTYIKLDLESKKELIFSLKNNSESELETVQMNILNNFLENILNKLEIILQKANE
jgi:hypothetical protein